MSETLPGIVAALVKFQAALEPARKDASNPHLKNKYASLAAVWEALSGPLTANGLAVLQPARLDGAFVEVQTILLHTSGEKMEFGPLRMPVGEKSTAQQVGSALTYARRYALSSLLGVVADDDDGHAASQHSPPPPPKAPAPKVESTPWQRALLLGVQRGVDQKTLAALVKKLANRSKPSEVTDADVEILAAYLAPGPNGAPSKFEADEIRSKEGQQ
jgi:hypothetical protein